MRAIGDWLPENEQANPEQNAEMGSWPVFCRARETVEEFFVRVDEWFAAHPEIARRRRLTNPDA